MGNTAHAVLTQANQTLLASVREKILAGSGLTQADQTLTASATVIVPTPPVNGVHGDCSLLLTTGDYLLLVDGQGRLSLEFCPPPVTGGGINWLPYGFMWGRAGYPLITPREAAQEYRRIAKETGELKLKSTAQTKKTLRALAKRAAELEEESRLATELKTLEKYLERRKGQKALQEQQNLIKQIALTIEVLLLARVNDDDDALAVILMDDLSKPF